MKGINKTIIMLMLILIVMLFVVESKPNHNKKNMSKYEKHYNSVKDGLCSNRKYDDNCIFKNMSDNCYKQIFNYIIEYGEVDTKQRNRFELCYHNELKTNK